MEARAALSRPGITNLPPNQNPVKMDAMPLPLVSAPLSTTAQSGDLLAILGLCYFYPLSLLCSI